MTESTCVTRDVAEPANETESGIVKSSAPFLKRLHGHFARQLSPDDSAPNSEGAAMPAPEAYPATIVEVALHLYGWCAEAISTLLPVVGEVGRHFARQLSPDDAVSLPVTEHESGPPQAPKKSEVMLVSGAARALSTLYGQPFENTRIEMQSKLGQSMWQVASGFYKKGGITALYKSVLPNAVRMGGRDCYRLPIQVFLPELLKKHYPDLSVTQKIGVEWVALTLTDTIVNTPTNRIATIQANNIKEKINQSFGEVVRSLPKKELCRGFSSNAMQQGGAWLTFLGADALAVKILYANNPKPTNRQHAAAALGTGVVTTVIGTPLSLMTTLSQRAKDPVSFRDLPGEFVKIVKTKGPAAAFTGGTPRLVTGIGSAALSYGLRRHFDQRKLEGSQAQGISL